MILEGKEFQRFKGDLDNERRALFRERRELAFEMNQLASTRSCLVSTLQDFCCIVGNCSKKQVARNILTITSLRFRD